MKVPSGSFSSEGTLPLSFFSFNFWLCWIFVAAYRLSLVSAGRGYSLVAVPGFLIVVALLVAEHGFPSEGSVVLGHRLSCWGMWNLPRPGIEPVSPALQVDPLPLDHPGSPECSCLLAESSELSGIFYQNTNPIHEVPASLPKDLRSHISSPWGLRFQCVNFKGDTNIQPLAISLPSNGSLSNLKRISSHHHKHLSVVLVDRIIWFSEILRQHWV